MECTEEGHDVFLQISDASKLTTDEAPTAGSTTLFDYAMASTYNTATANALAVTEEESSQQQPRLDLNETSDVHIGTRSISPNASDLLTDKKTGRPSHPAWEHFTRGKKRNRFHHNAFCKYCAANSVEPQAIRGVSENMIRHLQKCTFCPATVVAELRVICAQRDAVNFNKRHQAQPHIIATPSPMASTPTSKSSTEKSTINGSESKAKRQKRKDVTQEMPTDTTHTATPTSEVYMALQIPPELQESSTPSNKVDLSKQGGGITSPNVQHVDAISSEPIDPSVMNDLILKATLASGLPLDWFSTEQWNVAIRRSNPGQQDDSSTQTRGFGAYDETTVASLSERLHHQALARLTEETCGVTLAINVWFNESERVNWMLLLLISSCGDARVWSLIDVGMEDVVSEKLSLHIKNAVEALENKGIQLVAIVTDTLCAYAAAKLVISNNEILNEAVIVLPSFEMILVNSLGTILAMSDIYVDTMGKVIDIVRVFSNKRVRELMCRESGDADAMLVIPAKDTWYSFIECIDSVRQFEDMIKFIASKVDREQELDPEQLNEQDIIRAIVTPRVLEIIQNPHFWETVVSISELMSPIKETYRLMTNKSVNSSCPRTNGLSFPLGNIMYQFGRMYQQYDAIVADWVENPSTARIIEHAQMLCDYVNQMWNLFDHRLMYVAYAFNFTLTPSLPANNHASLEWISIAKYAKEYFRRWFGDSHLRREQLGARTRLTLTSEVSSRFLTEVLEYKARKYPFKPEILNEYLDNPRAFYELISDSHYCLHHFGSRIYSVATSTPYLGKVIPYMNTATRSSTLVTPHNLLLPLAQIKVPSSTILKPSRELQVLIQHHRSRKYSSSSFPLASGTKDEGVWSAKKISEPCILQSGIDEEAFNGLWNDDEWRNMAVTWKALCERERGMASVLNTYDTTKGVSNLSLGDIFKDKLPSRLQESQQKVNV